MLFSLKIWRTCISRFSLPSPCPPLSNMLFNPIIPDSLSFAHVSPWANAGLFQLCRFVHPVTCRSPTFINLQTKYHIPTHMFYFYLQITSYLSTLSPSLILSKPTTFELIFAQGPHQLHLPPQFLWIIMHICVNGLLFLNTPSLPLAGTKYGQSLPKYLDVWRRARDGL